jgi:uncharacterized membrane protein
MNAPSARREDDMPNRGRSHAMQTCQICQRAQPSHQVFPAGLVRDNVAAFIQAKVPNWSTEGFICTGCLNRLRTEFVRAQMEEERGELSALEQDVVRSLRESELVADNLNRQFDRQLTMGQRIADKVADFGGSWRFIALFLGIMAVWVVVNSVYLLWKPFDPYPYILLNLGLSLLAAIQAPVIMMSQNRQEDRDRLRAENDYKVNLKAELEIRTISEKLDQLIHHQWMRLIEIQQIQIEMIEDLAQKGRH